MRKFAALFALLLALLLPEQSWAALAWNATQTLSSVASPGIGPHDMASVNMPAGALAVVCVKFNTAAATLTGVAQFGGAANAFTLLTAQEHTGGDPEGRCAYRLSTSADAAYVVRLTFGSAPSYIRATLYVFTYTGTASFDVEVGSTEASTDLTPSSGNITPLSTGSDGVCVVMHADNGAQTFTASSETLNSVAGSGVTLVSNDTDFFYNLISTTFTSFSTLTRSTARNWIQRVSCFKTDAGGGAATPRNLTTTGMGN